MINGNSNFEDINTIHESFPNLETLTWVNSALATSDNKYNEEGTDTLHRMEWNPLFHQLTPALRKRHTCFTFQISNFLVTLYEYNGQIDALKIRYLTQANFLNITQSQQTLHIRTFTFQDAKPESLVWT
ncbi:hypothetical protein K501DRAFT_276996 [Backusella circina FSU 941]|nr:hypothetical protein K501DRAFT_276996 [Backusella circina FSU 941]